MESDSNIDKQEKIIAHLDELMKEGYFGLTNSYIKYLKDDREIILLTTKFFVTVRDSKDQSKEFSDLNLKRKLLESKIIE